MDDDERHWWEWLWNDRLAVAPQDLQIGSNFSQCNNTALVVWWVAQHHALARGELTLAGSR